MKRHYFFIFSILVFVFYSCGEESTADFAVDFTVEQELLVYDAVQFSFSGTGADSYLWDFGDGTTAAVENPSHKYEQSGDYSVSLTATNSTGSNTVSQNISVRAIPEGEYVATSINLLQPVLNAWQLIGLFNSSGEFTDDGENVGVGPLTIPGLTGQSILFYTVSASDYILTVDVTAVNYVTSTGGGGAGTPFKIVVDTREMEAARVEDGVYGLSDDEYSFMLEEI